MKISSTTTILYTWFLPLRTARNSLLKNCHPACFIFRHGDLIDLVRQEAWLMKKQLIRERLEDADSLACLFD